MIRGALDVIEGFRGQALEVRTGPEVASHLMANSEGMTMWLAVLTTISGTAGCRAANVCIPQLL